MMSRRGNSSRGGAIRLTALAGSTLAVLAWAGHGAATGRAQEPAGQPPGAASAPSQLLRSVPFDRITLSDNSVFIVDPVSPRPLPPVDPKKKDASASSDAELAAQYEGNITLPGERSKIKTAPRKKAEEAPAADDPTQVVKVHLLDNVAVRDYTVKRSNIRSIEYFEDMLLEEADRLVLARDFARAFECLLRVKTRNPSWPGMDEHVNKLLLAEGTAALVAGDSERGLRLLRELLARDRNYPGLMDQLASAYGGWIGRAIELRQFSRGRRYLHEAEELAGDHPSVRAMRDRFASLARDRVRAAEALQGAARLDALADALRTWPELEGAADLYAKAFEAIPTLDVAVNDVPYPVGPWVRSPADARVSRLLYRPILAADSEEAAQGKLADQLVESLESADLGRRLVLRVRPGTRWSDGSREATAADVARCLIDRTDPSSNKYQARWADALDRVAAADESRVEIRLKRPLVRTGSWFEWPVGPAHAGIDGRVATTRLERLLVTDGPFRCAASSADALDLARAGPRPEPAPASASSAGLRVMRIHEVRLPRNRPVVAALLEGDVTLAAHVPPDQVAALKANPEIRVGQYAQPRSHVLAIDARNPVLRNRSLRRGLSYAIPRKGILEDAVLRRPVDESSDATDGPFPKGSYANAPGVKPLEFNATLAIMLVAGARKELGAARIELKLEYPAIAEARAAMPKLVESLELTGIKIQPVEVPESRLESELRQGRRFDLAYRALRCEEPILEAGLMLCPGYDAPPQSDALSSAASPRILQLLLQLDRATELSTARGLAIQIDRESRDELPVIPLWQVADHYAWRTRLRGPVEAAESLYQGLATWEIEPWFARDPWRKP
ncbi:Bacterial extracellular solute-binding protein, family 5 Middle [Aquisphaera giovannonii]|uniref:Bacterial extracellular solute-binding protein, family 5 Middle n=1 Tax=Aquisphaera giovannonii TaxID=406548 RepID=A0A5B9W001_9BACT|nr:ABC transporter substrate-binding protein [Aquisphaera giovannonii]QEH33878.1 Bacterial extracellular solute-binding protein, family 5 Middle [Aquisphaera giovannonii]